MMISLLIFTSVLLVACAERWTETDEAQRIRAIKLAEKRQYQELYDQKPAYKPSEISNFWCYHCASPLRIVHQNKREAIRQFLKIRRTAYPTTVIANDCTWPINVTHLPRQFCRHDYCQTLTLTDHLTESEFTIRGCAESFGAINENLMTRRHSCTRLHDKLDIRECICTSRQICSTGSNAVIFTKTAYFMCIFLAITLVLLNG